MMTFTIRYVRQVMFGKGFVACEERVISARAAKRVLTRIREGRYPALKVWITCG